VKTGWEGECVNNGFTALEIDRLRTCFIACDEALLGSATFAENEGLLVILDVSYVYPVRLIRSWYIVSCV